MSAAQMNIGGDAGGPLENARLSSRIEERKTLEGGLFNRRLVATDSIDGVRDALAQSLVDLGVAGAGQGKHQPQHLVQGQGQGQHHPGVAAIPVPTTGFRGDISQSFGSRDAGLIMREDGSIYPVPMTEKVEGLTTVPVADPALGNHQPLPDGSVGSWGRKTTKPRPKPDPTIMPRRPMTSFLLWCKVHRPIVREKYKDVTFEEFAAILGKLWRDQPTSVKQPYWDQAKRLRVRYDRDVKAYKREKAKAMGLGTGDAEFPREPSESSASATSTSTATKAIRKDRARDQIKNRERSRDKIRGDDTPASQAQQRAPLPMPMGMGMPGMSMGTGMGMPTHLQTPMSWPQPHMPQMPMYMGMGMGMGMTNPVQMGHSVQGQGQVQAQGQGQGLGPQLGQVVVVMGPQGPMYCVVGPPVHPRGHSHMMTPQTQQQPGEGQGQGQPWGMGFQQSMGPAPMYAPMMPVSAPVPASMAMPMPMQMPSTQQTTTSLHTRPTGGFNQVPHESQAPQPVPADEPKPEHQPETV